MSCFGPNYNPLPARTWNRFEHRCAYVSPEDVAAYQAEDLIYIPVLRKYVPRNLVNLEYDMLRKGTVLQYKNNSANFTFKQSYALIAKGLTGVKKTRGTQSETYTNPNSGNLRRVNYSGITEDGTISNDPISCPTQLPMMSNFS